MTSEEMKAELQRLFTANQEEITRRLDEIERKGNRARMPGTEGPGAMDPEELKAFSHWARTGERKAMSVSSDPDGGYACPPQLSDQITLVGAEQGVVRGLARVYTPGTSDFKIIVSPTLAGAGRTTETSTRGSTTTPSLAQVHPISGGVYAVAPISNWLLNDSQYDIAKFVTESVGQQFGVTESADFVTGDGVNKATGFLSYPLAATADATRAFGTVEKLHAGSTTALTIDNFIDLRAKLAPRYRKNAAFVMHPDTEAYVRKLKASTSGDYYWQPSVAAGTPNTLLGSPCLIDVNMPVIASAAGIVTIADFQKFYAVVDIGTTTTIRDPYTSKGSTLFYFEKRIGGGVVDSNAGKVLVMSV